LLGTLEWSFYVHPSNASWYAVWTNLSKTVVFVHTNGWLTSKEFNTPLGTSIIAPTICIGSCDPFPGGIKSKGILNHRLFRCAADLENPSLYGE
jgi:hypothetical protein